MFVPDVLGVASALLTQMGPLPTYSFHTPPIYISCLSLLPVLTVLALRQHLPALTLIIMNGLLDPGFSPWPPPIPAVFLMPLPLSICPWMKTLHWLFTAYRKKSKLLNTGYSLLGLEACSLLHFISRYPPTPTLLLLRNTDPIIDAGSDDITLPMLVPLPRKLVLYFVSSTSST